MFGTYGLCLKLFYNFKYKRHNEIKKKTVLRRPKIIYNDIVKKKLFTIDENLEY
jgi:hypothetical protein